MSVLMDELALERPMLDLESEAARVGATYRLSVMRERHPELQRAEAKARLELAAAIIAVDEVEARMAAGEMIHSLHEQLAVQRALHSYSQALAEFLRGETPLQY